MTQFSISKIVRPDLTAMAGQYQGKSSEIPICWPGTIEAGGVGSGYINLMQGTPVPLGGRLIIWLPSFIRWTSSQKAAVQVIPYAWRFVWRLRNAEMFSRDFQSGKQTAFHFSSGDMRNGIFTVPAAVSAGILVGPAMTPPFDPSNISQLAQQLELVENWAQPNSTVLGDVTALGSPDLRPILANGGRAFLEQARGNASYPQANLTTLVSWNPIVIDALGDDLVILQTSVSSGTWSFTDPYSDKLLYQALYDNPDIGIYIMSGTGEAGTVQQQASITTTLQVQ